VIDDFSRFTWVFFMHKKSETTKILKTFITKTENQFDLKVKVMRSDNGTEFKNETLDSFCAGKGIDRQFSAARTPQQNEVVERKNRTLIEAARTMLADLKLPITFWAEAVSTACFVQNRSIIVKDHKKTPYELLFKRKPQMGFFRSFGCPVSVLNTSDQLAKFDAKACDGFFVGYSSQSIAYRVYISKHNIIEESMNVEFHENSFPKIINGPAWLFDIDALTNSLNSDSFDHSAGFHSGEDSDDEVIVPFPSKYPDLSNLDVHANFDDCIPPADPPTTSKSPNAIEDILEHDELIADDGYKYFHSSPHESDPSIQTKNIQDFNYTNLEDEVIVDSVPTSRIQKYHPQSNIIGNVNVRITRSKSDSANVCLFSCFLSQTVPNNISEALKDSSWIEAMQEELLQFQIQNVWTLVDLLLDHLDRESMLF